MTYKKYYLYKKQVSYDGGVTYQDVVPLVTAPSGDPIASYSTLGECEGVGEKFKLTLNDSSEVTAGCDETSAVTSGEVATQYSGSVVSAVIGDCVTSIDWSAFRKCTSLTSVTIPDCVTNIDHQAFYQCSGLTSIDIPSSVTSIGSSAFRECSNLTSIDIPSGVTSIGASTFRQCTSLISVTIPDSVTSIGLDGFHSCSGLTSVTIGSGVTVIYSNAFKGCSGLTSVTCNATTPPSLSSGVFNNTNNCPIYVPCESVEAYKASSTWSTYSSRIEGIPPCGQPTPTACTCDSFAFEGTEETQTNYITVKVKNNTGNAIYVNHVELYYANGDYDDEHDFGSIECDGSSATTTLTDQFDVMAGLPQTVTGATIDVCHQPQCSNPGSETVTFNPDTLTNEGDIITLTFNG